jgi:diguanylate cyclase (GGDEF)-like protein
LTTTRPLSGTRLGSALGATRTRAPRPEERGRDAHVLIALLEVLERAQDDAELLASTLECLRAVLALDAVAVCLGDPQAAPVLGPQSGDAALLAQAARLSTRVHASGRPRRAHGQAGAFVAATPVLTGGRALGVLLLGVRQARTEPPTLDVLLALGRLLGAALEQARQRSALRSAHAQAELLTRLGSALGLGPDLRQVLPAFARELQALQAFDRLACAFVNETGDYLEVVSCPDGANWGLGEVMPVVGSGPGAVALESRPICCADLTCATRFIEDERLREEGLRSYLLLPLVSHGRCPAVLALGAQAAQTFDAAALARLAPLAAPLGLLFENLRLFQKARELSLTDEVTPLYNFRFVHQILERELPLVERYGSVLSLIFLDLDRFKPINDRHGHLRGSRVLREVGFLLRAGVRAGDYPARYGGDEFVVVLPQTDADCALALAEDLRLLVEQHVYLRDEGLDARLGASVGVASYPHEARSKEALLRLADERMYADKERRKSGR